MNMNDLKNKTVFIKGSYKDTLAFLLELCSPLRMLGSMASMSFIINPKSLSQ